MNEITLIVLDVDGTLTDGGIYYDSTGVEQKRFHVADGLGIAMALAAGLRVAVISGRSSPIVERRMSELGVSELVQGTGDKGFNLRRLRESHGIAREAVAFVGDDINDLSAFAEAGLKIAVADADESLRSCADLITAKRGGDGAVREAIEMVLRRNGIYEAAVAAYLDRVRARTIPAN